MASAATLHIGIKADAGGLIVGVNKAQSAISRFERAVSKHGAKSTQAIHAANMAVREMGMSVLKLTRNVVAFGAASATAFALAGLRSGLKNIDAIAKAADKLGDTTEALVGFRLAAEQTGVGADQATVGLQRMIRRISQAAQGSGEAQEALQELGLDAAKLSAMTPTQAFAEVAQAMGNVEAQSDRVRLAFKLFDSEGVALVNTLRLGKDGLAEMQRTAEETGQTFSRSAAAGVEAANDAMNVLTKSIGGLANQLTIAVGPALAQFANQMTEAVKWVQSLDASTVKSAIQMVAFAGAFAAVITIIPKVVRGIKAMIAAYRALQTAAILSQSATLAGAAAAAAALAVGAATAIAAGAAFDKMTEGIEGAAKASDKLQQGPVSDFAAMQDEAAKAEQATAALRQETERWEGIGDRLTESVKTPFEKAQDAIRQANAALDRGVISWQTYQRVIAQTKDEFLSAADAAKDLQAAEASRRGVGAADIRTTAGFSAIQEGTRNLDAMRSQMQVAKQQLEEQKKLASKFEQLAQMQKQQMKAQEGTTRAVQELQRHVEQWPEVREYNL